jgi:hypothetical protein
MRRVAAQVTIDRRQINDDRRRVFGAADLIAFVCECGDDGCARTVPLSAGAYEQARATPPGLILDATHVDYSKNATTARIA